MTPIPFDRGGASVKFVAAAVLLFATVLQAKRLSSTKRSKRFAVGLKTLKHEGLQNCQSEVDKDESCLEEDEEEDKQGECDRTCHCMRVSRRGERKGHKTRRPISTARCHLVAQQSLPSPDASPHDLDSPSTSSITSCRSAHRRSCQRPKRPYQASVPQRILPSISSSLSNKPLQFSCTKASDCILSTPKTPTTSSSAIDHTVRMVLPQEVSNGPPPTFFNATSPSLCSHNDWIPANALHSRNATGNNVQAAPTTAFAHTGYETATANLNLRKRSKPVGERLGKTLKDERESFAQRIINNEEPILPLVVAGEVEAKPSDSEATSARGALGQRARVGEPIQSVITGGSAQENYLGAPNQNDDDVRTELGPAKCLQSVGENEEATKRKKKTRRGLRPSLRRAKQALREEEERAKQAERERDERKKMETSENEARAIESAQKASAVDSMKPIVSVSTKKLKAEPEAQILQIQISSQRSFSFAVERPPQSISISKIISTKLSYEEDSVIKHAAKMEEQSNETRSSVEKSAAKELAQNQRTIKAKTITKSSELENRRSPKPQLSVKNGRPKVVPPSPSCNLPAALQNNALAHSDPVLLKKRQQTKTQEQKHTNTSPTSSSNLEEIAETRANGPRRMRSCTVKTVPTTYHPAKKYSPKNCDVVLDSPARKQPIAAEKAHMLEKNVQISTKVSPLSATSQRCSTTTAETVPRDPDCTLEESSHFCRAVGPSRSREIGKTWHWHYLWVNLKPNNFFPIPLPRLQRAVGGSNVHGIALRRRAEGGSNVCGIAQRRRVARQQQSEFSLFASALLPEYIPRDRC